MTRLVKESDAAERLGISVRLTTGPRNNLLRIDAVLSQRLVQPARHLRAPRFDPYTYPVGVLQRSDQHP